VRSLQVRRVPARPIRVRAAGLRLVLTMRIRRAQEGSRQIE